MKLDVKGKAGFDANKLFLIDGAGALISAFLLAVVLVQFASYLGVPPSALYFLSIFPVIFAIYDFYCFYTVKTKRGPFLTGIAVANLLYCCLSLDVLFYHLETLTWLGYTYILAEIVVVSLLAVFELAVAKKLMSNRLNTMG